MKLEILDPTHVTLPAWLARTPLTLDEIGALFVLCAIEKEGLPKMAARLITEEFVEANNNLSSKGIFTSCFKDGALSLDLDLSSIQPSDTFETEEDDEE